VNPPPVSLHSPYGALKQPGMEKEPRLKRRGLDSETLTALQTAGPENLTTTTSAHAAEEAMNLLILAVVRLERALQRVHPPTFRQGKHTRNYTGGCTKRQVRSKPCRYASGYDPGWITFIHRTMDSGDIAVCPCFARHPRAFHLIMLSTYPLTSCPQCRRSWG
jgi:hypothetical protein